MENENCHQSTVACQSSQTHLLQCCQCRQSSRLSQSSRSSNDSNCTNLIHSNKLSLNREQKKCLICILLANFACYVTYAVIAPFFTLVAQNKGLDQLRIDMIFSGYALASVLISPVCGRLICCTGPKPMLLVGLLLNGSANILFGFLDQVPNTDVFFNLSLALRCLEAFGTISMVTACYTYVIKAFPNCVGYVFGLTETAVGLGLCLGPALGGPLFALGGYGLPFFFFGSLVLVCVFLCASLITNFTDDSNESVEAISSQTNDSSTSGRESSITYIELLSIPRVQFLCLLIVLASACQNFTFPTLEVHLNSLGVSEVVGSLEFFLYSFFYMCSTPLVGRLNDSKHFTHFGIILLGNLFGAIGFLIVGPASFLQFAHSSLAFTSVGLMVMGFSLGFALIPTFDGIVNNVRKKGVPDDLHTYGKISGLWTCMFSFGEMIGPQLSGSLMEQVGFRSASTCFAFIISSMLPALLCFILIDWVHSSPPSTYVSTLTSSSSSSPSSSSSNLENANSTLTLTSESAENDRHRLLDTN